ncbi:MAG: hypothetical protein JWN80_2800 [Microbacteriaceae bacterium]|nr:hypothetical protein [Microbacteriaceae bacterium]
MSTHDPDAFAREIGPKLKPLGVVLVAIGVLAGPVFGILIRANTEPLDGGVGWYLAFLFTTTGAGIFAYYIFRSNTPTGIAAYCFAGFGGMIFVINAEAGQSETLSVVLFVGIPYVIAIVFGILYLRRHIAATATLANGVDADATVTRVGVDGMVNFVQHQRATLTFTDQQGTQRWFRVGLLGGGVRVGDTIPIRYDGDHPGNKRAIVVRSQ